ncbi:TFIIS helical bundle-like domain family protein [Leishmania donovani]|uniref:TFIIS helical bundle-like domain family protein n=1 Tax=Leishmania donovani TaxID=5661 RepID=A0A504Y034_LEIDO|nr:TFIIS helical bundle-like domain family protein [Leishmania donovani]
MEEEDSILGLVPASLPVHADSEDSVVASGYVGGGPGSPAAAGADTDDGHGGASAGAAEGGHADDVMLLSIGDKKAAKRLGKRLYKRWKKLHKASQSKKDRHKSSKKAGSQNMADGADDVDGELGLVPAADLSDAAAAIEARLKKAALRESKMRTEKAVKKAAQRKTSSAELAAIAKELVAAMAKARQLDEDIISGRNTFPGAFPLNRVALKSIVQARCRQGYIVGPLVEAGILQELSYWLYDVDRADPAPYELRTAALDILVSLPMEGSIAATEDLTAFMGVSREHLIKTDLGRALNALRRYNEETIDNKGKCVQLLTTFSRVISGASDKDQMDEHKSKAVWKCQRDPTVASPFEVLETCSEAFQKSFMKPDPRDPTSYNGVLPWRPPAATITNVSGKLGDYIEKANINPRR